MKQLYQTPKKLVLVLATPALVIKASKEEDDVFDLVLYICYLIQFKKNEVQTLINFDSKINAMTLIYISKLGLRVCSTNVKTQKINSFFLKIQNGLGKLISRKKAYKQKTSLKKLGFFKKSFY